MANEYRIDYISQLKAFREVKLNTPGLTAGMISVYYALLDMNNQSQWSEEFDVDFGYMMALAKVDKTTYYKAMEFFLENEIIASYTKGLNAYTRAKVTLCLLYEKSIGNTLGKQGGESIGNTPAEQVSDHHYNKTLNNKLKKETINIPFDDFWNLYPVKVGRKEAENKWKQLTNDQHIEIISMLPLYVKYEQFPGWNHPNPCTFLNKNKERWKDDLTPPQKPKTEFTYQKPRMVDHSKL